MKYNMDMVKGVFYWLIGIFVVIIGYFVIPASGDVKRMLFPIIGVLGFAFFTLGGILIYLTLKLKVKGKLKKFLMLTGGSAIGVLVSVILHNLVYGLFIYLFGGGFWERVGLGDEPLFFFLALFVLPITFLIGIIGSIVQFNKKK